VYQNLQSRINHNARSDFSKRSFQNKSGRAVPLLMSRCLPVSFAQHCDETVGMGLLWTFTLVREEVGIGVGGREITVEAVEAWLLRKEFRGGKSAAGYM
jgi:hypothetical protein